MSTSTEAPPTMFDREIARATNSALAWSERQLAASLAIAFAIHEAAGQTVTSHLHFPGTAKHYLNGSPDSLSYDVYGPVCGRWFVAEGPMRALVMDAQEEAYNRGYAKAKEEPCACRKTAPVSDHPWRKRVPAGTFVLQDVESAPCDDCGRPWQEHSMAHVLAEVPPSPAPDVERAAPASSGEEATRCKGACVYQTGEATCCACGAPWPAGVARPVDKSAQVIAGLEALLAAEKEAREEIAGERAEAFRAALAEATAKAREEALEEAARWLDMAIEGGHLSWLEATEGQGDGEIELVYAALTEAIDRMCKAIRSLSAQEGPSGVAPRPCGASDASSPERHTRARKASEAVAAEEPHPEPREPPGGSVMPDVKLLSPEKVADLEALDAALAKMPIWQAISRDGLRVIRDYEESVIEAAPSLLPAARLLPEMAKALVVLEGADDRPDWVEEFCRASLARYRALSPEQEGR